MFRLFNVGTCIDDYEEITLSYCKLSRWEGGKGILLASTLTDGVQYTLEQRHLAQRDYDATVALLREASGMVGQDGKRAFALRKELFG